MVKTFFRIIVLLVVIGAAAAVYFAWAPVTPPAAAFVLIKQGSSARGIAAQLQQAGVIRNANAFLAVHALRGKQTLKAGEYAFNQPANSLEVYDRIARGDVYFRTVVIPEGYNIFDIAQVLEASGLTSKEAFLEVARGERSLIADLDPQAPSLEGYLFPDTYHFSRTQSARELAAAMVKRFRQEAQALGITGNHHHIVTLASIVEKETSVPSERPLVAGVFTNRLAQRIGLATDPSVIYAALLAGRYRGTIYQSDLTYDSPYNTYKYSGLPPGPIANPGRASLEAAMRPLATDFIYFVADNKGGHNFARTLEEHNRNVANYRNGLAAAPK
jgi:UPF0755 protein